MLKRLFRISAPVFLAAVVGCSEEAKDSNPGATPAGEGGAAATPTPETKPGGARSKAPGDPTDNMPSNKMVD